VAVPGAGLPATVLGIVAYFYLQDKPEMPLG
jgi:hypothetical protein